MLEEFKGKKVEISYGPEGETSEYNLQVIDVDGPLIKIEDLHGNPRVINTSLQNFFELKLMK